MSNCFNTPFQRTIVRSRRAAIFVLHVNTYATCAMFVPRSRALRKILWSLVDVQNVSIKKINISQSKTTLTVYLFTAHHMWHTVLNALHILIQLLSKKGIACSPTTSYCCRIDRSFSLMQSCNPVTFQREQLKLHLSERGTWQIWVLLPFKFKSTKLVDIPVRLLSSSIT